MIKKTQLADLRAMLKLAEQLRQSASETDDEAYATLFMEGASRLEERVHELAFAPFIDAAPQGIHWTSLRPDKVH